MPEKNIPTGAAVIQILENVNGMVLMVFDKDYNWLSFNKEQLKSLIDRLEAAYQKL